MSALKKIEKWGEKDFHAGWTEEHNPYHQPMWRKLWLRGFKRAKGRAFLATLNKRSPDGHLGAVCE